VNGNGGAIATRLFQIAVTGLLSLLSFLGVQMWQSGRMIESKVAEEKVAIDVLSERLNGIALLNDQRFHDLERRLDKP
jgi:hypothetical protein